MRGGDRGVRNSRHAAVYYYLAGRGSDLYIDARHSGQHNDVPQGSEHKAVRYRTGDQYDTVREKPEALQICVQIVMALTVFVMLAIYLAHVSRIDIERREISNAAPIIIIMSSPFITELFFSDRAIGFLAVFVPTLIISLQTNWLGMGDVKLLSAVGFTLGAIPTYVITLLALSAALVAGKIQKNHNKEIPLAPYICTAAGAVYILEVIFNA